MPAGIGAELVPKHLGVHMGVAVDEAGRHHMALGVDYLIRGLAVKLADGGDSAVADGDIGAVTRRAGAVDHGAALDDEIVSHLFPPIGCPISGARIAAAPAGPAIWAGCARPP